MFTSVDHLPAEMPTEASDHFGSKLIPFVEAVVRSDFSRPIEEANDLPEEVRNAIITCDGKLTHDYAYIQRLREANEAAKGKEESESNNVQGFAVCLIGHLFDTQTFNQVIDACEMHDVNFRIIEWNVGNCQHQETSVSI